MSYQNNYCLYRKVAFPQVVEEEECNGRRAVVSTHHLITSQHKLLPRVVFDTASKHGDVCLNDCLESGPVAFAGDVSDMFRHVRLDPRDCKYHCYLWCGLDVSRPPYVYRINCLVFGDKSSPCEAEELLKTTKRHGLLLLQLSNAIYFLMTCIHPVKIMMKQ